MAKSRTAKKSRRPAKAATKSARRVQFMPKGYQTLTPGFCVRGAVQAIDFYKRAFGATERMRLMKPDGTTLAHAELQVGGSRFMLGEEDPGMGGPSAQTLGGTPVNFYLYVKDVDAAVARAQAAGAVEFTIDAGKVNTREEGWKDLKIVKIAKPIMLISDMFWGDRIGGVEDPYGQKWTLATHKEDVAPREMAKRAEAFYARMAGTR